ncbi:MAG: methionine synthase, partial [Leptolyngbyaceae cyanobacterium CAN_BIN12]|nr:methionine synthase [Leptolyngbyaceae cyanobacterium CAN_BIN12]
AENWDDLKGFLDEQVDAEFTALNGEVEKPLVTSEETKHSKLKTQNSESPEDLIRSDAIAADISRPTPPFWGTQILNSEDIPWDEIFWHLDLQALIAGQWQFRKPRDQSKEEYDQFLQETVYPILERWKTRIVAENLLQPQVIYGYFPCQSAGNSVHLYDPAIADGSDGITSPLVTWKFPRQKSLRRYCIADFFAAKESGQMDVFPMQAVTAGHSATEFAQALFKADSYTEYLYFHGLSVQIAEALSEWTHARIRRELGFGAQDPDNIRDMLAQRYQGSRYSFGYPACPEISYQYKQLELLGTDRIGMVMDESEQLYPEQSTTAIVAYHPAAKYFSA